MKACTLAVVLVATSVLPLPCFAQTQTFEGTAVSARGSLNPPDPGELCGKAKRDATDKAAKAGYKGAVKWERLSTDNDCKLSPQGAANVGYFYIFTAKGAFSR